MIRILLVVFLLSSTYAEAQVDTSWSDVRYGLHNNKHSKGYDIIDPMRFNFAIDYIYTYQFGAPMSSFEFNYGRLWSVEYVYIHDVNGYHIAPALAPFGKKYTYNEAGVFIRMYPNQQANRLNKPSSGFYYHVGRSGWVFKQNGLFLSEVIYDTLGQRVVEKLHFFSYGGRNFTGVQLGCGYKMYNHKMFYTDLKFNAIYYNASKISTWATRESSTNFYITDDWLTQFSESTKYWFRNGGWRIEAKIGFNLDFRQ